MEKNLYIDASHPNETRIVLKSNYSIEEYEFEDIELEDFIVINEYSEEVEVDLTDEEILTALGL